MAGRKPEEEARAKLFPACKRCLRGAAWEDKKSTAGTSNTYAMSDLQACIQVSSDEHWEGLRKRLYGRSAGGRLPKEV